MHGNRPFRRLAAANLLFFAALAGCTESEIVSKKDPARGASSKCDPDAYLTVEMYGAIDSGVDWRGQQLECLGMRRPHGRGARLRFAGILDENADGAGDTGQRRSRAIAFILSIPDLKEGETANELATGVTLMEENEGRFFSTQGADICWSNIERQAHALDTTGNVISGRYSIGGITYCLSPIIEINGATGVTLSELQFRGQLDWKR